MRQEIGTLRLLYIDEMKSDVTFSKEEIQPIADSIKTSKRNWTPVIVIQTGSEEYHAIGNQIQLEATKEAGLTKVWCIIADNSEETKKAVETQTPVKKR